MGAQSDSKSALMRGASDTMACSSTFVCWNDRKHCRLNVQGGRHTLQFSRIRQRPPARDLSGPEPFGESLTPQSNLTIAEGRDFASDVVSSMAALGSMLSSGRRTSGTRPGTAKLSASSERMIRGNQ